MARRYALSAARQNANVRHQMTMAPKQIATTLWLLFGVPMAFAAFVSMGYAVWGTPVPFTGSRADLFVIVLTVLAISGAVSAAFTFTRPLWLRIAVAVAYFASMSACLPYVALLMGCVNRDCL
jgi:hypothetical protein